MASFWYTPAKERLANGGLDWDNSDIRCYLAMTNTTADTDQDAGTLSAIGTPDEYDGTGYSRASIATEAVVRDDANNRAELGPTTAISFGATVGAGTRSAAGMVVYQHVDGTAANDKPVAWVEFAAPINGGGGAFTVTPNAEGLLQVT
jgi:hypothetical protein